MIVRPDVQKLAEDLQVIGAAGDPGKMYPLLQKALDEAFIEGAKAINPDEIYERGYLHGARGEHCVGYAPALPQGDGAGE